MKITILGAAKSGLAAAALAKRNGDVVFVTDSKPAEQAVDAQQRVTELDIEHEFGSHSERALQADLIVTSPGVPPSNPIRIAAAERGIRLISELEFAASQVPNKIVAITGTNGKTTTTALTAYILNQAGRKAVACGNFGIPLSSLVGSLAASDVVVAEVSSYQLDTCIDFKPSVSALLNITPDHLSYHGSFEQYVKAKWKIFAHQGPDDIVILNADDPHAAAGASHTRGKLNLFSIRSENVGAYVRGDDVFLRVSEQHIEEVLMPARRIGLPGVHNLYNSMAAALAARALEVRNEDIRDSLQSFNGVEHRLENVRTLNGVRYVNDSKATNINAAWYALSSYDRPIVWIAGGRGDNNDYTQLDDLVLTNVKAIICIGEEADPIFNHWCTEKRCIKALTMDEAVRDAASLAEQGDVVLFSPACKSFDMFANFEERGAVFKTSVASL